MIRGFVTCPANKIRIPDEIGNINFLLHHLTKVGFILASRKSLMNKKEITIYAVQTAMHANETVLIVDGIKTGFPNPTADYLQESIDMNKVIIQRPENTFVIVAEKRNVR